MEPYAGAITLPRSPPQLPFPCSAGRRHSFDEGIEIAGSILNLPGASTSEEAMVDFAMALIHLSSRATPAAGSWMWRLSGRFTAMYRGMLACLASGVPEKGGGGIGPLFHEGPGKVIHIGVAPHQQVRLLGIHPHRFRQVLGYAYVPFRGVMAPALFRV